MGNSHTLRDVKAGNTGLSSRARAADNLSLSGLTASSMSRILRPAESCAACKETVLRALSVRDTNTEQVRQQAVPCAKGCARQLQDALHRFCSISMLVGGVSDKKSEALSRGRPHGGPLPRPRCMHV